MMNRTEKFLALLKKVERQTEVPSDEIGTEDKRVLDMFRHIGDTGIFGSFSPNRITAIGLPGTDTPRAVELYDELGDQMTSFEDILRLDGLAYGGNVRNEAQKDFPLSRMICSKEDVCALCRDVLHMEEEDAVAISESVGSGKGFPYERFLEDTQLDVYEWAYRNLPGWFVHFCDEVKYLVPRTVSEERMLLSWRLAWYRLHRPAEFYRAYFEIVSGPEMRELVFRGLHAWDDFLEHAGYLEHIRFGEVCSENSQNDEESYIMDLSVAAELYYLGLDLICYGCEEDS